MLRHLSFWSLSALALSAAGACRAGDLLIRNVTVVSPERDLPLHGAEVLIRDGRIVAVGEGPFDAVDATVLDGAGGWLTPGLIATSPSALPIWST